MRARTRAREHESEKRVQKCMSEREQARASESKQEQARASKSQRESARESECVKERASALKKESRLHYELPMHDHFRK